jgi:hypothetical protein
MYETRKREEKIKVRILSILWVLISFFLMKYRDRRSRILQVPLMIALSPGSESTQDGIALLSGKILKILL